VKILVPIKRVADPDNANKVRIGAGGQKIDTGNLEWKLNPFDEYALEAALRLNEDGKAPKARLGEVIVVSLGPKEVETNLRSALATGADRALRIDATDEQLDGRLVALALKKVAEEEQPDLILMGKQAVDGDSNQVGQILAELLDLPMATFAATIQVDAQGRLQVSREVDGGVSVVRLTPPALITVDLRIVAPTSVYSAQTDRSFKYNDGVRFAPLPAIMAAKRKKLDVKALGDLVADAKLRTRYTEFAPPPERRAGKKVSNVAELVAKLANEAKVI
jgi:electron transfer flavoprotein beta subunit